MLLLVHKCILQPAPAIKPLVDALIAIAPSLDNFEKSASALIYAFKMSLRGGILFATHILRSSLLLGELFESEKDYSSSFYFQVMLLQNIVSLNLDNNYLIQALVSLARVLNLCPTLDSDGLLRKTAHSITQMLIINDVNPDLYLHMFKAKVTEVLPTIARKLERLESMCLPLFCGDDSLDVQIENCLAALEDMIGV